MKYGVLNKQEYQISEVLSDILVILNNTNLLKQDRKDNILNSTNELFINYQMRLQKNLIVYAST